MEQCLRLNIPFVGLTEHLLKGQLQQLQLFLQFIFLLLTDVNKLFLHLIDEVDAFFDGMHDGVTVHLELFLAEVVYHLIQQPVLLLDAHLCPFAILEGKRAQ